MRFKNFSSLLLVKKWKGRQMAELKDWTGTELGAELKATVLFMDFDHHHHNKCFDPENDVKL